MGIASAPPARGVLLPMSVPKTQVIALVVASVLSVALTIGGLAILTGSKNAAASTDTPEASISSGSTVVVPVLPGDIASAEPQFNVVAIPTRVEAMPLGPIDDAAIAAGFKAGGYRFTVTTINFASFAAASPIERGVVTDARHFVLEWPESAFISRYVRDGADRTAWLGDSVVDLVPGDGWERTPDEMLPIDFYTASVAPWTGSLPAGSVDGTYAAKPEVLTSEAQALGVTAADWALSVTVDGRGRLVAARFEGVVRGRPFRMVIDVTYEDRTGSEIPIAGPEAVAEPSAAPSVAPSAAPSAAPSVAPDAPSVEPASASPGATH